MTADFDYALVGGGLQNGLVTLAIRAHQPAARIAMIERDDAIGGNHTWCFHARDVEAAAARWVAPLVVAWWPAYDVAFPDRERRLATPYACVSSARLAREVGAALRVPGSELLLRARATTVTADAVEVVHADGTRRTLRARAVLDARGPDQIARNGGGWQKFVGRELRTVRPHGLALPRVMDARVPQRDGFRFFYVLPLAPDRLLIEETFFSDTTRLDVAASRDAIADYARANDWPIAAVAREEVGILPMPLETPRPSTAAPLVAGYAGGWFHPATGYSFPVAVRLAAHVGQRAPDELHGAALDELASAHGRQLAFATRLNRMLFRWFAPERRHHALSRFYGMPDPLIERFYALALTRTDRARLLVGRPPRGLSLRAVFGGAP